MGKGPARARLMRRLMACVALLSAVEATVRTSHRSLEAVYLQDYRLPNLGAPGVEGYARVVATIRQSDSRIIVGMTGPSFVWGAYLQRTETVAAQLQSQHGQLGVYNIALPGNRFDDDRAIAYSFRDALDVALVPLTLERAWWEEETCPQHLGLVEWSRNSEEPYRLARRCVAPPRHFVHAWMDEKISSGWTTYRERLAIRARLFPESGGDIGKALLGKLQSSAGRKPTPVDSKDERFLTELNDETAEMHETEGSAALSRLCDTYATRGVTVLFYEFPQLRRADESSAHVADYGNLRAAAAAIASKVPNCRLFALPPAELLHSDFFDAEHPTASGAEKIARWLGEGLAEAVRGGAVRKRSER